MTNLPGFTSTTSTSGSPRLGSTPSISPDAASATAAAIERLAQSGDRDAWAFLVQAHGPAVHRLVSRICGNASMGDDACQQAFLAVRAGAPGFRTWSSSDEAAAVAWIMRVACTAALKTMRTHRRHQRRERPLTASTASAPGLSDEESQGAEHERAVSHALTALPEHHREALHLHFHAGLGYPELAQAMAVSITAARVRVHRALAALRQGLRRHGVVLSVSALELALRQPSSSHPFDVQALMHLRSVPLSSHAPAFPLLATAAVGALASCVSLAVLVMLARSGQGAEEPGVGAATAAPVAGFLVPPARYPEIEVHVEFEDTPLSELPELFTRVLHIPLTLDAALTQDAPPPVTLLVDHIRVHYVLDLIARLCNTTWSMMGDGSLRISGKTPPEGGSAPSPDAADDTPRTPFVFSRSDTTPERFLKAFSLAGGAHDDATRMFWDVAPLSLRLYMPHGLQRQERLLRAISHGACDPQLPFEAWMCRVETRGFSELTINQALQQISSDTGVPCRFDSESGTMPLYSRVAQPIECGMLLEQLATAAGAVLTQASDGMVIYRPRYRRFADGAGHDHDVQGTPYEQTKPAWWYARAEYGHLHLMLHVPPVQQLMAVEWREATVAEIAQDLHARLLVPVRLVQPQVISARRVLVQLPRRPLGSILACLENASRCHWEYGPDGITVSPWEEEPAAPVPGAGIAPPSFLVMPPLAPGGSGGSSPQDATAPGAPASVPTVPTPPPPGRG